MNNMHPPRWADRFLEWYCHPDVIEEIQGDIHEIYFRRSEKNRRIANIQFVWNVIRFFRIKNIKKRKRNHSSSTFSTAMLRSYFVSAIRNIMKNVAPSSINIIGLSIALACGVTIFLLVDSYYHRDTFHEKGDRLFLLMNKMKSADEVENWARSPYLLGPSLKEGHTAVESVIRVQLDRLSIKHDEVIFTEPVWFVDPEFFNAFSYQLLHGTSSALSEKNNIILTEDMAIKYFGRTDVVNEDLSVKFHNEQKKTFRIGAVLKRIPDNSSMHITFLIPMQNWEDLVDPARDIQWRTWAASTFVLFKDGRGPAELDKLVSKYKMVQNAANDKFQVQDVEWIPIDKVGERSYDIMYSLSWSNIPAAMIAQGVIATFLVLLACLNYMNVAIASVSTRLKEIGIRKVIGGGKKEIIHQFLLENLIFCALALLVGTGISYALLLPGFNTLYPIHVPFEFSSNGMMFGFFGGVLLFVAMVSGAYPALYVSSFSPVNILKGKEKFGSKSLLSKILLSIQFTLSFTTVVSCLIFVNSSRHFEQKDWGYGHSQHVFTAVRNVEQFNALKDLVSQNKSVISFAGTESHFGHAEHSTTVSVKDAQVNITRMEVGFNYLETMDVRLESGRFFDQNIESDKKESVIINEAFVRKMGWKDPLNKSFDFDGIKWYVIGVVKDFNYKDFYYNIDPVMIHIGPEDKIRYLVVKAETGSLNEIAGFLKKSWSSIAPDDPYEGWFQDEVFQQFFNSNRSNDTILYFVSTVALVLASMGLYGLVSYNLTRRLKEFSVRKVFGADLLQIFRLMNSDYIWIIMISFAIGAPAGFYLMGLMIKSAYPEHIPITMWPFVTTIAVVAVTVAITIASQLKRVSNESPTKTLRSE